MFHVIAAAAVKVAVAAVGAGGHARTAGGFAKVDGPGFGPGDGFRFGRHRIKRRMAGARGSFGILAGGIVANKAIGRGLCLCRGLAHVLPAVACMTGGAARLVPGDRSAKGIDNVPLSQALAGFGVIEFPLEVDRMHDLIIGLGVAGQAGLGYFGAGGEILLQNFEFRVVRGAIRSGDGGRVALRKGRGNKGKKPEKHYRSDHGRTPHGHENHMQKVECNYAEGALIYLKLRFLTPSAGSRLCFQTRVVWIDLAGVNKACRDHQFGGVFNGHVQFDDVFLGEEQQEAAGWVGRGWYEYA